MQSHTLQAVADDTVSVQVNARRVTARVAIPRGRLSAQPLHVFGIQFWSVGAHQRAAPLPLVYCCIMFSL
jgi:hypothetical protein